MIFRQLFEPVSSTYTYLLGCETTGQAMLIDPVVNAIDRDLQVLQSLRLAVEHHSLDLSIACKPSVGSPTGHPMAPRSTTSVIAPSRPRCTAWCSSTPQPSSPRLKPLPGPTCRSL